MFFKNKCPICGAKNSRDATTCASCGTPFESRQAEDQMAIRGYDEAIRINPKDAVAYFNRGNTYHSLNNKRRAIEDYDQAIYLNPRDAVAYNNRGNAYKLQGREAEAIADLEKFITLTDNPQWAKIARQQIEELQS